MQQPPPLPVRARSSHRALPAAPLTPRIQPTSARIAAPFPFQNKSNASDNSDLLRLSPEFLQALRKLVPARRRKVKVRYFAGLGLLVTAGVLGTDPSTREFAASLLHHSQSVSFSLPMTSSTPPASAVPHVVVIVPTSDWTPIALSDGPGADGPGAKPAAAPAPSPAVSKKARQGAAAPKSRRE
jgi:hypothetical protein